MTTKPSGLSVIQCLAGVEPETDKTAFLTQHYTFADKVRFVDGTPEKIGGNVGVTFERGATCKGAARSVFSIVINGKVYTLIGTNQKLYVLIGSRLTNITPLQTLTNAIANSIDNDYDTLGADPFQTTIGESTITVTDANASKYVAGDIVLISGATAVGGVGAGTLNTQHIIRSVGVGNYTINPGVVASSTASGGGASVIRATGVVTVNAAAHGQENGDRVKITGSTDVGGILAADINKEFIIRNITTNTFDIVVGAFPTSSVSAGGGASTAYQKEIADGRLDASLGQGYGMGLYGVGLYGVSKLSTSGVMLPRVWYFDKYGETVVMTAGNQTKLYVWDGDVSEAPVALTNAPTEINYVFSSNNIVITFGADGSGNHIFTSDIDDNTNWTASSINQVFEDFIEGAGRFLSHVSVGGTNLIFTEDKTYTFRYIGLPNIWEIRLKSSTFGIISAMARCTVNDVAYWMDDKNFYMWNGGNVEVMPANSQKQSTILRYVFDNLNFAQKSKCFAWYNRDFHEVWFHYPSAASLECDRVARCCLHDYSWVMDTSDRTAAEYPDILLNQPRLAKYNRNTALSTMYRHEVGDDDDGQPLAWQLTTNLRTGGKDTTTEVGIIPDSGQSGEMTIRFRGYLFPQSTATTYDRSYTITPTTERVTTLLNGRFWKYTFSGSELGQGWQLGKWQEYIQGGATN